MRRKAFTVISMSISAAIAVPVVAQDVRVVGDRYDLNVINNFYNTSGYSSSILGSNLTGADLTGVELLWAVQPADAYSLAEMGIMADYLANGGRIAFMGEHGFYAPNENNYINAALASLGSSISIFNDALDGGFNSATVANGQILSHPLTNGVTSYEYAAFAPLTISGSAQALMLGADLTSIMMAYQNVGPGSVFLITDQNVWDNSGALWPNHDNEVMFRNLVTAQTGAPPVGAVPEPATWAMLLLGFGLVGGTMRRNRKRQNVTVAYA